MIKLPEPTFDGSKVSEAIAKRRSIRQYDGHALDGTPKVEVEHIGMGGVNDYAGGLRHGVGILAVNLYGHGALLGADGEFLERAVDIAHQGVTADELTIDHAGSHLPAQQSEANIRHVLHGGKEHGAWAEVKGTYFHLQLDKLQKDASLFGRSLGNFLNTNITNNTNISLFFFLNTNYHELAVNYHKFFNSLILDKKYSFNS